MTAGPLDRDSLQTALRAARIVPVLRAPSAERLVAMARDAVALGCSVVELTSTTPGWREALKTVVADPAFAEVVIALGTVTDTETARDATDLGARFLVSPFLVAEVAVPVGMLLVQGGLTPGELATALRSSSASGAGAAPGSPAAASGVVKLFPASSVGVSHLRAVRDVLPDAAIMPTGGISLDSAPEWLAAGAIAVGIGTALFRDGPATAQARIARIRETE